MASVERELHQWLQEQVGGSLRSDVLIGVGDDAAVISGSGKHQVITTDSIADGTHFLIAEHSLKLIGRKSLAINLSDIAAMGARPRTAVLSWMLPRSFSFNDAKELFQGIQSLAQQHDVQIIGGDTNCWNGPLVVGATVIGQLECLDAVWKIGGASPGDAIFVSGKFGGSILGHHLSFEPAVELANRLAELGAVAAATDASDSLTSDLQAMAVASGCGAELSLDQIPISDAAFERARLSANESKDLAIIDQQALQHALTDGEDFGLIIAVPTDSVSALEDDVYFGSRLTRIGSFIEREGLWARQPDGALEAIEPQGYDH